MDAASPNDRFSVEDQPRLVMETGPQPGLVVLLAQEWFSLGRAADNAIVLRDLEVSRHHARLRRGGQGWLLEDVGSSNGTYVNGGRLLAPHLLRHGDVINLSEEITFTYRHRPLSLTQAMPVTHLPARPAQFYAPGPAWSPGVSNAAVAGWDKPGRRSGRRPWLLVGLAVGLLIASFLCLALLAYLTMPELAGSLSPIVIVVPGGASITLHLGTPPAVPPPP